jgi:four helix bundle protein
MVKITRFEDLKVWRLAHKLSLDVAKLVKNFPRDEKYDLADQMRRSARSIPSDISEGFGRYHFNDKLTFYERARASLGELRNHFKEALGNGYVDQATDDKFSKNMNEIGFLLSKMMKNIRAARDLHEAERKSKRPPSRRLTSNPRKVD